MLKLFKRINNYFHKPIGLCEECHNPVYKKNRLPSFGFSYPTNTRIKMYECYNCGHPNTKDELFDIDVKELLHNKDCSLHLQRVNKKG
jgi:hypothetical protein